MNHLLVEGCQIVPMIVPVNLATAANNGDWVSLKNYGRCTIVFFAGAGAAAQDPTLTLMQARDVSGTGAAPLPFTRVDIKQASALTGVGTFTTVNQDPGNTYSNDTMGETQNLVAIEVRADQLDEGFTCLRLTVADTGSTAKYGCALAMMTEPRYAGATLPSAIVD